MFTIGLVYGGKGAEEFTNYKAIKDIERVLGRYAIKTYRLYLNQAEINFSQLEPTDLFMIIDSNCTNMTNKHSLFEFAQNKNIEIIGQNQRVFTLARNKFLINTLFTKHKLKTPRSFLLRKSSKKIYSLNGNFTFPIIIKDNYGSSSENISLCFSEQEFNTSIEKLLHLCKEVIVEEYIPGKELTIPYVNLFNKKIMLNPIQIIYSGYIYDYKTKNRTFRNKLKIPPSLDQDQQYHLLITTILANKILRSSFCTRLDLRMTDNQVTLLEINGEPVLGKTDFLGRSAKTLGISYANLIIGLLASSKKMIEYGKTDAKLHRFIDHTRRKVNRILKEQKDLQNTYLHVDNNVHNRLTYQRSL